MTDPYVTCPTFTTEHFTIRLIRQEDSSDLFECYHDRQAVSFMNDDNCDFGFYVETPEAMAETVKYWIQFYKERAFIRFAIVDTKTQQAVGTIEGFHGTEGVLRVDIRSAYETKPYLQEIVAVAVANFKELFGNEYLVIKAVKEATERRSALLEGGWEYIDIFRTYSDYYKMLL